MDGLDKQSCPAIVCCGGRMDFHGVPMSRTWVKLAVTAKKGHDAVTLSETVQGWRAGDHILITDSQGIPSNQRTPPHRLAFVAEERRIRSMDGTQLVLNAPLEKEHIGADGQHVEVANLSRNVVVESADPKTRGHTMYHRHSTGSISYAEFRHLGKEGVLGRYPLHYHLCGDTMRGSSVIGASIWDSHNRWLTIHGTNYLIVRDCVGYQSLGHGFFLEDGTEVYNVLDRNLAVQAYMHKRQNGAALPFDANLGAGFWWANCHNTFTRNVACENNYGFFFEARPILGSKLTLPIAQPDGKRKSVDIRTLPFVRFEDNETHTNNTVGFNLGEGVGDVGPDARHPFIVRNLKIWLEGYYAFRPMAPSVLVEGLHITCGAYGIYHPNFDRHVYKDVKFTEVSLPFAPGLNGASLQNGMMTADGVTFEYSYGKGPGIYLSENNPSGKAEAHFRNIRVVKHKGPGWTMTGLFDYREKYDNLDQTWTGVPMYFHDYFGPGRAAKVLSVHAREVDADKSSFRDEPGLTGKLTRATEVTGIAFPKLLNPVDDLPPVTVITHVRKHPDGKLTVRGTTADNGVVKRVLVNGKEARAIAPNFTEWEINLDNSAKLEAHAEDAAGNVERNPHHMVIGPQPAKSAAEQGPTAEGLTKLIDRLIELDSIDLTPEVKFREGLEPSLHALDTDESKMVALKDPFARIGHDNPGAAGWYRLSFFVPEKIGKFAVPKSGYNLGIESNVLGSWEIYTYKNGKPAGVWSKEGMNKYTDRHETDWMSNAPQPAQAGDKFTVAILAMASPLGRGSPDGFGLRYLRLRFSWGHTGGRQPFYGGVYAPGQGNGLLGAREMLRMKKGDELKALQEKLRGPIARLDAVFAAADTGQIDNLTKSMTVASKEINEALKK